MACAQICAQVLGCGKESGYIVDYLCKKDNHILKCGKPHYFSTLFAHRNTQCQIGRIFLSSCFPAGCSFFFTFSTEFTVLLLLSYITAYVFILLKI